MSSALPGEANSRTSLTSKYLWLVTPIQDATTRPAETHSARGMRLRRILGLPQGVLYHFIRRKVQPAAGGIREVIEQKWVAITKRLNIGANSLSTISARSGQQLGA